MAEKDFDHKVKKPEDIRTWSEYYVVKKVKPPFSTDHDDSDSETEVEQFEVDEELNGKLSLWRGDITLLQIDAIVNAANKSLLGGGGVDGAIHRAAGRDLVEECQTLHGCAPGEAKITKGYDLPSKHVIHTVGPIGEKPDLLISCYRKCFALLLKENLRTIAFPCISTGVYGYPNEQAAHIALRQARKFLSESGDKVDRVIFCIFLEKDLEIYEQLLQTYFPVVAPPKHAVSLTSFETVSITADKPVSDAASETKTTTANQATVATETTIANGAITATETATANETAPADEKGSK